MKRFICVLLSFLLALSFNFSAFASTTEDAPSHVEESALMMGSISQEIVASLEPIPGIEYREMCSPIENISQMPYALSIDTLDIQSEGITLSANVTKDGEKIFSFMDFGHAFISENLTQDETGKLTILFEKSSTSDYRILNLCLFSTADGNLLLNLHQSWDQQPVIELAIEIYGKIIFFEGKIPLSAYQAIHETASHPAEEKFPIDSFWDSVSDSEDNGEEVSITISDLVHMSESWMCFINSSSESEVDEIDRDPALLPSVCSTNATPTGVPSGLPASIFINKGSWASVKNPANLYVGYYAITTPYLTAGNMITRIISWEYFFDPCDTIQTNSSSSANGLTKLRIHAAGEYIYVKSDNRIMQSSTESNLRLSDVTIAMGLMSNQNMLKNATSSLDINGSSIKLNWVEWLGLIPNKVFSTIETLMSSIEYIPKNHSDACMDYQSTASAQKAVYGNIIRGRRVTADKKMLAKTGDNLRLEFRVIQPSDLTRTSGTKEIANKYYFFVRDRNPVTLQYTTKLKTVSEHRSSTYRVL